MPSGCHYAIVGLLAMAKFSQSAIKKLLPFFIFFLNTGCVAYALATRFTDFLFVPRTEKLDLLFGCLVLGAIFSAFLYLVFMAEILRSPSLRLFTRVVLGALFVSGLLFLVFYTPPPFPEQHQLTITALGEQHPDASNSRVHIQSISTISYPSGNIRRIPKTDLTYDGVWRGVTGNDFALFVENGSTASVTLERFMQAGIALQLQTGPDGGIARILWDGQEQTLDLYQTTEGTISLDLEPGLNWSSADRTRKILVTGAMLAELIVLLSALTVVFLAATQIGLKRVVLDVRNMRLIVVSVVFIIASVVIVQRVNTPVVFENPALELGIRRALNRPQGSIYQRQLLVLVELDLSNLGLTSLDGIEQLSNLSSLNLRDNNLSDISPLSELKKLESLDLRNNQITDISPLSNLERLEYLNVFANTGINSIAPLAKLTNMKKLILANVPIGEDVFALSQMAGLEYLNLRNTHLVDISFLASLTQLKYLNLYSNDNIQPIDRIIELADLETLILANIPLGSQAHQLSQLDKLSYLNLRNTGLTDIAFLKDLSGLQYLNLRANPNIQSIAPLAELDQLQHLNLRDVPVNGQVNHLENLIRLQTLNLRSTGISDPAFLARLAAQGALQDNPKLDIRAEVDIRDNPILIGNNDPYAALRPFWKNISFREPLTLPFYAALEAPSFSKISGFYENDFLLTLSHDDKNAQIYFTLDGSEPTANSTPYADPIPINHESRPLIKASRVETIASNWEAPKSEIPGAVVLRAKVINTTSGESSAIATHTYFVGKQITELHTLPIVSITVDFEDLFDPVDGIYVLGEKYLSLANADLTEDEKQAYANFNQRGQAWERPVNITLFDAAGQPLFSQNAGIRIHGGGSRRNAQKSLRVYADCAYDSECFFTYPIFPAFSKEENQPIAPIYETFLLRNNGQDWLIGMMRDALAQDLLAGTGLDTQNQQPVTAFINGEYWGIYQLQERYDEYYLRNHYGIPPGEATILRQNGELFRGSLEDARNYSGLMDYIRTHDLSAPQHFAYVNAKIDLENYTDYLIANIFLANTDWPDNNIYLWKNSIDSLNPAAQSGLDGRWRWMIFDMDFSFGLQGYGSGYEHNTLLLAQKNGWSGELFRSLLENENYRVFFINRFAHHLNTTFTEQHLTEKIDHIQRTLAPEMDRFFARWGSNNEDWMEKWHAEISDIRAFAQKRELYVTQHIIDQFKLGGSATLRFALDAEKGIIMVNALAIEDTETWEGAYFKNVPITIAAVPKSGYQFSHWEGSGEKQQEITLELVTDTQLTPIFIKTQSK